jgi:hypothetical protein
VRTVNGFMATGRPTGAASKSAGVVLAANEYSSAGGLLLEMALQAKSGVAFGKHARVDGAVRPVAGSAPFADRFVLEDERPALSNVALAAGVLFCGESGATPDNGLAFVRVVTIRAGDSLAHRERTAMGAFQDWMSVRQTEFTPFVQVTFETGLRGSVGIGDGVGGAARFFVNTPRAVATFATDVDGMRTR